MEDENFINVHYLQSCYLKPEEIINKEIFYKDDLQYFLYLSALSFGVKPSQEGKKLRTSQGDRKFLLTESAIYTAWL